jgi:hypothetical protein
MVPLTTSNLSVLNKDMENQPEEESESALFSFSDADADLEMARAIILERHKFHHWNPVEKSSGVDSALVNAVRRGD